MYLDEYSEEEDEEFGIDEVTALTTGKIGAKKLRRIQAKAEKKALREVGMSNMSVNLLFIMAQLQQEESLREDRKRREAEREETRKAQEEKRKKQEELEVSGL